MTPIPVCIISLPSDEAIYQALAEVVGASELFQVIKITGVPGHTLPEIACLSLTRDSNSVNNKGALGCFLSHVRAWEAIAASEAPFGIVLEDDIICGELEILTQVTLPADYEVIFINDRASLETTRGKAPVKPVDAPKKETDSARLLLNEAFGPDAPAEPEPQPLVFSKISESLASIDRKGKAVGGDGYILSNKAAKRLLSLVSKDRFHGHVDMRILAYCIDPTVIASDPSPKGTAKYVADIFRGIGHSERLIGYSTAPSLVTHKDRPSRRVEQDILGKVFQVEAAKPETEDAGSAQSDVAAMIQFTEDPKYWY